MVSCSLSILVETVGGWVTVAWSWVVEVFVPRVVVDIPVVKQRLISAALYSYYQEMVVS